MSKLTSRILEELQQSLRDLNIDDQEYLCLKAIVLFDPSKFSPQGDDSIFYIPTTD